MTTAAPGTGISLPPMIAVDQIQHISGDSTLIPIASHQNAMGQSSAKPHSYAASIASLIGLDTKNFEIIEFTKQQISRYNYTYGYGTNPNYGATPAPATNDGHYIFGIAQKQGGSLKEAKPLNIKVVDAKYCQINCNISYHGGYNCPLQPGRNYYGDRQPVRVLFVTIEVEGTRLSLAVLPKVAERLFNLKLDENLEFSIGNIKVTGLPENYVQSAIMEFTYYPNSYRSGQSKFDLTVEAVFGVANNIGIQENENIFAMVRGLIKKGIEGKLQPIKPDGISKVYAVVKPIAEANRASDVMSYLLFNSMARIAGRTIEGVKVSSLFNDIFGEVKDADSFKKAAGSLETETLFDDTPQYYSRSYSIESAIQKHPAYAPRRKQALKSKGNRAFTKLIQEFESLSIDEKKFPRISKLIKDGKLPIGTFFRKSEQYFLLNDNWGLWEEMLKRGFEEEVIKLAEEVSKRSTYEKDLMSYFYFILYGLPDYLKKHTKEKWTCMPRLVESASELEPPADDGTGTRRQRSALTPIVDNDKKTVTVPYASLAIGGGFGTTYCYSHNYTVLSRGFSFNGNAVLNDVEEKLNGRDDYGLMFYTLTGSAQGRGYPSFLIIFERRSTGTHVHFHRTHPSRSKDGDYNPIHNWVKVCYNWMAGNIRRDLIKYQQGDLVFVAVGEDEAKGLNFDSTVNSYDNHAFEKKVEFARYEKKEQSNILGFVRLTEANTLQHKEHEWVPMEPGTYQIRQCRSWEANPKGVWSLRID